MYTDKLTGHPVARQTSRQKSPDFSGKCGKLRGPKNRWLVYKGIACV